MYLNFYLKQLGYDKIPEFLLKYLKTPSLLRLKKIGYFCGMDCASKDIYNFREYISRYDHSLTVSLLTYKLTKEKKATLAGLFHDISTPCFSHVIDYMNKDYEKQESTEEYTEKILNKDTYLLNCLKEDNIRIEDIINFKKYTIVDNDRPKLCADRLDGVILTGIGWTKNLTKLDIKEIVKNMQVFQNEDGEKEIGFKSSSIAQKVLEVSNSIDIYCHSKEDNYMMELLAKITKNSINRKYLLYDELYSYNEQEVFDLIKNAKDEELRTLISHFENIKKEEIHNIENPKIKIRKLNPIANGMRLKSLTEN